MLIRRRIEYKNLGPKIATERKKAGMTQAELGEKLGKHRKWLSELEREAIGAAVDEGIIKKIEEILEVKLLEY